MRATKNDRFFNLPFVAPQVGLEPTPLRLTAGCSDIELLRNIGGKLALSLLESGDDLLSRAVSSQVPSTLKGLTSVFGMGTGGTPSLLSPEMVSLPGLQVSKRLPKVTCILPLRYFSRFALRRFRRFPRFSRRSLLLRAACSFVSYSYRSACRTLTTAHFEVPSFSFFLPWSPKTSARPISNDNLHALPRFQRRPIYLLVFQGSHGNLILVVGFTLRCFQRLSRPYFASQLCPWQDNCCTSGTSTPVLSY